MIGVAAPAGPVDTMPLDRGILELVRSGFRVREGAALRHRTGFLAGSDIARATDINQMLSDAEIRAIFLARGGYGCHRLLPIIDWEVLAATPKIIMGASDCTALLCGAAAVARVVTFHGPMVAGALGRGEGAVAKFLREDGWLLQTRSESRVAEEHPEVFAAANRNRQVIREGEGEGTLMVGCLALFAGLVGTPYLPDLRGAVLCVEDVNEQPFRLDRMVQQLRLAGLLDGLSGLVVGSLLGCGTPGTRPSALDVFTENFATAPYPVVAGFPFGHAFPARCAPFGARVRLTTAPPAVHLLSWPVDAQ